MRLRTDWTCIALVCALTHLPLLAQEPASDDAGGSSGVPTGKIDGPHRFESKIYPGTVRDYWLYVPAQYTPDKPACVLVVQDGLNRANEWKLPEVMDRLIHEGAMPVTVGVFVDPGVVPASRPDSQDRYNRSFEYDALGDRYARFLLEELLPEVEQKYALSHDPNDRAIAGASSGAICAFTVAWERPDAFRRVLSTIGTYVGLRGGEQYATLVRKYEPKPIRVFLQDGSNDLNIYGGDWWLANQEMLSALRFAGYDVQHAWGDGGHDGRHGAQIMPDALRWLWRDYPQPITARPNPNHRVDILIPGEEWTLVSEGHRFTEGPAVNDQGELFFSDIPNNRIHRVTLDGKVEVFVENSPGVNGLMFGPDGMLYACQNGNQQLVRFNTQGEAEVLLEQRPSNDLVVLPSGGYYTDPANHRVWYVDREGNATVVDEQLEFPNGVITSPDQSQLYVSDTRSRSVWVFRILPDGRLDSGEPIGYLHIPDGERDSGADGMTVDTEGRLYVTTNAGLQVLDQLGRCNVILDKPQDAWLSNVVFAGPQLDTLYVTCGDKVYKRKIKAQGVRPWRDPVKPPRPRL